MQFFTLCFGVNVQRAIYKVRQSVMSVTGTHLTPVFARETLYLHRASLVSVAADSLRSASVSKVATLCILFTKRLNKNRLANQEAT